MTISAVLLMAGSSTRFDNLKQKTLYQIDQQPLFMYSLKVFYHHSQIEKIVLVCHKQDIDMVKEIVDNNYFDEKILITVGATTRLGSLKKGLAFINSEVVLVHDVARPLIQKEDLDNIILASTNYKCGSLYHKIYDTVKMVNEEVTTIDREQLKATTTPQFFHQELYQQILQTKDDANITDEIMLFEKEYPIAFIEESRPNLKLTTKEDLDYLKYILMKDSIYKIGHSFDFHPFVKNRPLYLGGIKFSTDYGLMGHSDADAVYHAVTEALIGAISQGDIGDWFPDNDKRYLNANSKIFLEEVIKKVQSLNYTIENIDILIYLEKPNLKNYKALMAQNIKELTRCQFINVKATTLEKKGLVGKGEGIACEAVVLIKK